MALRSTLPLLTRAKASRDIVDRFLCMLASSARAERPPFRPYLNPSTGRWAPALISARRQAKLATAAFASGRLSSLPPGPKTERLHARLEKLQAHHDLEALARDVRFAPPRLSREGDAALRTAKVEGYKGPYTGRKVEKMFKGSKADRSAEVRRQEIRHKLQQMQSTVKEWVAAKAETKAKAKASLPF
ncbi:hypothetical protein ACQY0O_004998 [Thecaphora frezii]